MQKLALLQVLDLAHCRNSFGSPSQKLNQREQGARGGFTFGLSIRILSSEWEATCSGSCERLYIIKGRCGTTKKTVCLPRGVSKERSWVKHVSFFSIPLCNTVSLFAGCGLGTSPLCLCVVDVVSGISELNRFRRIKLHKYCYLVHVFVFQDVFVAFSHTRGICYRLALDGVHLGESTKLQR